MLGRYNMTLQLGDMALLRLKKQRWHVLCRPTDAGVTHQSVNAAAFMQDTTAISHDLARAVPS